MSAKFLRRGAGSFFGRQSRNFKSQYISCVEAEQRDFRAECQTLNSNNILCAKFPRGGAGSFLAGSLATSSRSIFLVWKRNYGTSEQNIRH